MLANMQVNYIIKSTMKYVVLCIIVCEGYTICKNVKQKKKRSQYTSLHGIKDKGLQNANCKIHTCYVFNFVATKSIKELLCTQTQVDIKSGIVSILNAWYFNVLCYKGKKNRAENMLQQLNILHKGYKCEALLCFMVVANLGIKLK